MAVRTFGSVQEAADATVAGEVDAVVADAQSLEYFATTHPSVAVKVLGETFEKRRYAFAVRLGDEDLLRRLNVGILSLREGGANIAESYASVEGGELWLINGYIAPYLQAKTFGHDERRRRKLLVSKKELSRLWSAVGREGMTIVPMKMYFNDRGSWGSGGAFS